MIRSLAVVVGKDQPQLRNAFDPAIVKNFERVTGIKKTRRFYGSTTELAIKAARALLEMDDRASLAQSVIVVTQSQDRLSPCMAVDVHRALGLPSWASAFDVNQSCDGFIYGLWLAARSGLSTIVVCVDRLRARQDTIDSLIFSDGACAFFISDRIGMSEPEFFTDGEGVEHLRSDTFGLLQMNGGKVFDFVTRNVPRLIKGHELIGSYDILAQHQPNASMMGIVESRSGFSGKSLRCVEEYGNMSMSSIAAALAHEEEKILGKKVLLCGYGAGWCAALMGVQWPDQKIARIEEVD